jgi:hypothetical protein
MRETIYLEGLRIFISSEGIDPDTNEKRVYTQTWTHAKLTLTPAWAIVDGYPSGRDVITEIFCFPRECVSDIHIEPYEAHSVIAEFHGPQDTSK